MPTVILEICSKRADRNFLAKRDFRLTQVRCKKELLDASPFKAGDRVLREGWVTPRTVLGIHCYANLILDLQTDPSKRMCTCYDWGQLYTIKPEDEFGPFV
jgi:hypothetical protein